MNEHFVSVKVDREERPDLDAVYMEAVVALSGQGGWPMTVFLTPDGEPFYGGTYYPPEPRHGLPSFPQVLDCDRGGLARAARRGRGGGGAARRGGRPLGVAPPVQGAADRRAARARPCAASARASSRRSAAGGARRSSRTRPCWSSCSGATATTRRAMVTKTLDEMAAGGMYDLLGGGFHRYSVDDRWLVPHFEKMLYDNALLAAAYLHGWLVTGDERYREVASATVEYMLRELLLPEGGFASAQDADTDGVEGLTFTWTEEEGAPPALLEPFEHGRSIIRGDVDPETRARLLELREQRPKPLRDDKAIASWNGLALAALAEAARRLERPDWVEAARNLGSFLLGPLSGEDGRLRRSRRDGRTSGAGLPRRLRERRARAARAPRRDRRAALARGGEPAGAAGGRALRRRRARRLLPLTRGRRAPGRADEGAGRPSAPVRQRDARARAAAPGADLRRRRARAARRGRAEARAARARAGAQRPSAGRCARSTCT